MFIVIALAWRRKAALNLNESWPSSGDRKIRRGRLSLLPQQCPSQATQDSLWTSTACTVSIAKSDQMSLALYPAVQLHSRFTLYPTPPQLLECSSRLFWEHLLLFTLSSQPWLQPLSATSLLQTISFLSKLLLCNSKLQQLLQQHYSRSVTKE